MIYVKILLILSLTLLNLEASTTSDKFVYAKKNYVTAVLKGDKQKEIIYLKQIITYGNKLGKNVDRYKEQLRKLDKTSKVKVQRESLIKEVSSSYDIKSVYTDKNSVIINFNRNISTKDIDFNENKIKNAYQDIFDIKGRFKDAKPTKLELESVDKITILQYRYDTLRIIFNHKKNPNTIYIVNKNQIIIKSIEEPMVEKKRKKIKQ